MNVRIANFAAINPRTFIWKFSSFSNHLPPVNTALLKVPQSDFDASACITKFGSFCLSDLPLFNLKFSTHQRSCCFDKLFNTISASYEQAWFSDCISIEKKVIVFVVVVNSLAVDELAELLGQLRTSDLSMFLSPKQ